MAEVGHVGAFSYVKLERSHKK